MDVDGPDVAGGVTGTAAIGQGVPSWQQAEAGAALERPNVEMTQVERTRILVSLLDLVLHESFTHTAAATHEVC